MKRGISTLVAIVVIIAITVIAAVGLYFWLNSLSSKQATPNAPVSIVANPIGNERVLIANLGQRPINATNLKASAGILSCPNVEIPPGGQVLCNLSGVGEIVIYGEGVGSTTVHNSNNTNGEDSGENGSGSNGGDGSGSGNNGGTPITGCINITSPGYYTLDEDIIDSNEIVCINITVSNVELDCNQHVIDANATQGEEGEGEGGGEPVGPPLETIGILAGSDNTQLHNITIVGCNISDWRYGVRLFADNVTLKEITTNNTELHIEGSYSTIMNNIIKNTEYDGISCDNGEYITIENNYFDHASSSIKCDSVNHTTISGNNIQNGTQGINVGGSWNNITNNTITSDGGYSGIYLRTGKGNLVSNNRITNTPGYTLTPTGGGIQLGSINDSMIVDNYLHELDFGVNLDTSYNNTIANNIINNTWDDGIELFHSSANNTVVNNTITQVTYYGINVRINSHDNKIVNNTIDGAEWGLDLYSTTSNTIRGNRITGCTDYGIYLSSASNNVIYNNYFDNAHNYKFSGTTSPNTWNSTVCGNWWSDTSPSCTDNNGDSICDSSKTLATDNIDYKPIAGNNWPFAGC